MILLYMLIMILLKLVICVSFPFK